MAGITDSPYRRLCRQYGAGLLYSECISAEGIRRLGKMSLDLCRFHNEERPIAIQLFGSDPQQFADAAAIVGERFQPDLIDVNCGCPVKRLVTRGCGGALMKDPEKIGRIVEAIKNATDIPVSVKLRTGYSAPDETVSLAARVAVDGGAVIVAVHSRWVRKSKGTAADWDVITRVRETIPDVPLIGNGDVFSFADVRKMKERTGCDMVMIGRWACGKPWIFQFRDDNPDEQTELWEPLYAERIDILLRHYQYMLDYFPYSTAVHRMRKHIGWYTHGMPNAAKLRLQAMSSNDADEVINLLNEFKVALGHHEVSG